MRVLQPKPVNIPTKKAKGKKGNNPTKKPIKTAIKEPIKTKAIDSDLRNSDYKDSDLQNSDYKDSDLQNSDYKDSDLQNSDYKDSDLQNSDYKDPNYKDSEFNDPWGILQATRETKTVSTPQSKEKSDNGISTEKEFKDGSDTEEIKDKSVSQEINDSPRTQQSNETRSSSPEYMDNSVFNIMKRVQENVEQIQQKHKKRRK